MSHSSPQHHMTSQMAITPLPPVSVLPPETLRLYEKGTTPERQAMNEAYRSVATVRKILRAGPAVTDSTATNDVYDIFRRQAELNVLAVLREGDRKSTRLNSSH